MTNDLKAAFDTLAAKQLPLTRLWQYYEGEQPMVYTAKRLRQLFNKLDARFSENWCAVVVDTVLDRVDLQRFDVGADEGAATVLNEFWEGGGLSLAADDVHTAALVTGEGFLIVWPDASGEVEAYYHDPRQCHIFFDPERPRIKRYAAKRWVDEDGLLRVNLYYPNRIEYYRSWKKAESVQTSTDLRPMTPPSGNNPYGEVPVFRIARETRKTRGELVNVIEPQDAVNKLLADMMVAAEFGAYKQRFIISGAEAPKTLRNAPNEIWNIPQGEKNDHPTEVGEFSSTDLKNYFEAIDKLVHAIGVISRTPKHYFFSQGGDPSGEALIAMEAPLNNKVRKVCERFGAGWREIAAFILKLKGYQAVKPSSVTPVFDEPQTVQPFTEAQIRQLAVQAGIPLRTELRREGWTDKELDEMEADRKADAEANEATMAGAMIRAQREFDRGGADRG
ncbi:MAG: phage portal protein [Fimbriimonas sp.]